MWSSYHAKLLDAWTQPLERAPRWLAANSYGTLNEFISPPDVRTTAVTGSFTSATSSLVPDQWVLTQSASTTGSVMQRFFEVFVNEKEFLLPQLDTILLSKQFLFNVSNPEFCWVVESIDPVNTLTVGTATGTVAITKADSDLDLFYSGSWRWKQDKTCVIIYGLDIQSLTDTEDSADWHFIDALNKTTTDDPTADVFSPSAIIPQTQGTYLEHPATKNWFPVSIFNLRSDGFLGYNYDGTLRIRSHSTRAAKTLETVTVYINGEKKLARLTPLVNSVDEKSYYCFVNRRYKETNASLAQTLLKVSWFRGQTFRKLRSTLSASLRTGSLVSVAASASSFSYPASATGYCVRNINPWNYVTEYLTTPVTGTSKFYTRIASSEISCGYLRGIKTDFSLASGQVTFDTYIDNTIDRPIIDWKVHYFTETASAIHISDNFPHEVPNIIVFMANRVDVTRPSEATLRKSFKETSPTYRWSRTNLQEEFISGLADFDF